MDILVCVKQVPDDFVEVRLDPATQLPATAEIERVANAFDTYAVELAVRYCEANGGTVTAACIGGESAKNTLKNLIAVGVNKAYLFNDEGLATGDESAKAGYLAQVIKTCEEKSGTTYGLILCGKESTDEISGQVGAILAEKTGLPFVSSVIEVAPNGDGLIAKQETEDGIATYETASPALFTIAKPGYDPRYPSIKSKMAARKAEIPVLSAADAGLTAAERIVTVTSYTEPPKREAGLLIQEKVAADAVAKAIAAMKQDKAL